MKFALLLLVLGSTPALAYERFGKCTKEETDAGCYLGIDAWCDPWAPNDTCIYRCFCPDTKPKTEAPEQAS